jgi:hypothetical protein
VREFRVRLTRFSFLAICCLGPLSPTVGFALPRTLSDIACDAIWRGCNDKCTAHGGSESCYNRCNSNRVACDVGGPITKQQTPPPPCRGVRCNLPVHNPPTTVGQPTHPPRHPVRPVKPVRPVSVSNPNTGNNAPVILLRNKDSGGQGHRH